MAKNKFYTVFKGREIGVFNTWRECEVQTKGFKGAEFKSYPNREDADEAFKNRDTLKEISPNFGKDDNSYSPLNSLDSIDTILTYHKDVKINTICVDGACAGNPGKGDYQCVDVKTGENIFLKTDFEDTTNNIMEFLALVDAIKYVLKHNDKRPIYSDSITAMAWVRNKKTNSNLRATKRNFDSKKSMTLAEEWLKSNDTSNVVILKWKTKEWGEIPADFGRK